MKKDQSTHRPSLLTACKDTKVSELIIESKCQQFICLIDFQDYDLVYFHKWHLHNKGYAVTTINGKTVLMHRLILGVEDSKIHVDHRNHNKLDNRRENIRMCTPAENRRNSRKLKYGSSKWKGVYRDGRYWHSQIIQDGNVKNLGRYRSEKTAAKIYDQKAKENYKEFACLNFPDFKCVEQLVIPEFL